MVQQLSSLSSIAGLSWNGRQWDQDMQRLSEMVCCEDREKGLLISQLLARGVAMMAHLLSVHRRGRAR
jgi:hypothetical protein